MADARLLRKVEEVADRLRQVRKWKAQCLAAAILSGPVILAGWFLPTWGGLLATTVIAAAAFVMAGRMAGTPRPDDRRQAALLIEKEFPRLDARLLTALQESVRPEGSGSSYLQSELLTQILEEPTAPDWQRSVSSSRMQLARWGRIAAGSTIVLLIVANTMRVIGISRALPSGETTSLSGSNSSTTVSVEPGNVDVEKGTSLLVIARFNGPVPSEVHLVATDEAGQTNRWPLSKSLDDPLFGGRIPSVEANLTYHVEFDNRHSPDYSVSIFEYPQLVRADARIAYPDYTRLDPKTLEDVRKLTMLEGSRLDWALTLNKPVREAVLVSDNGERIPLSPRSGAGTAFAEFSMQPQTSGKQEYRLELVDEQGRANREPPRLSVNVISNLPPDLKIAFPSRDLQVTALQELLLQASAKDDFGVTGMGLVVESPDLALGAVSGSPPLPSSGSPETLPQPPLSDESARTIEFPAAAGAGESARAEHLLVLEELNVSEDDLVSYYFYADDFGPDGAPRRTVSPMYFAEVRPFDLIYRQGEAQSGQSSSSSQQGEGQSPSAELLDLQRDVVSATWNVIREMTATPGAGFAENVRTLAESQTEIEQLAAEAADSADDALIRQALQKADGAMKRAAEQFQHAADNQEQDSLRKGRTYAQEAYHWLLRARAREMQVVRADSQSRQGQQGGQRKMDQQLQALKLKNDRNRYETERQARQEQTESQRAALAVLDRLKELARRQQDLNNRIRELENALRSASSEQEREELQRQLKRLQEEQQEMLRNVDDLQQQLDQQTSNEQLADAREQIDETRERVMRASEALQQQQLSRALAEGTRAERNFQQMQDQVRNNSAGRFDEEVRELRQEVRDLAQAEQSLHEQLQQQPAPPREERPSLRDTSAQDSPRSELTRELEEQKQRLGTALDHARELVEKSESAEPLLSRKLYDALRDLQKFQPEEALEAAARANRYGLRNDVQNLEEQARKGIDQLQQGVEEAARSILGNEASGLHEAQSELSQLIESIRNELAQNDVSGAQDSVRRGTGAGPQNQKQQQNDSSSPGQNPEQASDNEQSPAGSRQEGGQTGQEQPDGEPQSSGDARGNEPGSRGERSARQGDTETRSRSGERGSRNSRSQGGSSGEQSDPQQEQQSGGSSGQQSDPQSGQQSGQQSDQQSGQPQNRQSGGQQGSGQQPGNRASTTGGGRQRGGPTSLSPTEQMIRSLAETDAGGGTTGGPEQGLDRSVPRMPISGQEFQQWSERMRDVEEMLADPDLRAQVASIRERARQMRIDVTRHSQAPNWQLVRTSIYGPMLELEQRITEELARRNPQEKLVPIDRDPVPDRFSELVRAYYESLSRQRADGE